MLSYLKEHPTIVVTLLLLYSSLLGITYDYLLYSYFNINIFQVSEIEDFLFSWIKNEVLIISLVIIYTLPITEYIFKGIIYKNKYNKSIYTKLAVYKWSLIFLSLIIILYAIYSKNDRLILLLYHIIIIYYIVRIRYYHIYNKLHTNKINSSSFIRFAKQYFLLIILITPFLTIHTQSKRYAEDIKKLTYQYYYIKLRKMDNELEKYAFVGKNSNYHIFYKGTEENNEIILINNNEIKYFREENKSNIIYEK